MGSTVLHVVTVPLWVAPWVNTRKKKKRPSLLDLAVERVEGAEKLPLTSRGRGKEELPNAPPPTCSQAFPGDFDDRGSPSSFSPKRKIKVLRTPRTPLLHTEKREEGRGQLKTLRTVCTVTTCLPSSPLYVVPSRNPRALHWK